MENTAAGGTGSARGIVPIVDAGGKTIGDLEPTRNLASNQQTVVERQPATEEPDDDLLPGNR